ncbi:Bacterial regulatory protein, tetR family [Hartmannibacter diazotrophicus]|uniref:Bacterial regulatory protein, tetR family n=2 Tax=Hartmannibacter diazotrophicus TaxID=1482074 RepID=A0A2C9D8R9_9HYPH|nr:Bacterial regulatory protein, tetR family [Hartmannibacter diazotrophicus]
MGVRENKPVESKTEDATPARRRTRIKPEERYREFVRKAVALFAEVGFGAGTRELAQRLGVTQPLLYRYFPSKDDLIAAVYREIYENRWKPEWRVMLEDDAVPIRDRMIAFYEDYTATIFMPEWLRIYLFAGLRGVDINKRYMATLEREILIPIARATRRSFDVPDHVPLHAEETELFWHLHSGIFYYGIREIVYMMEMPVDRGTMIRNSVDIFLKGAEQILPRMSYENTCSSGASTEG